LSEEKKVKILKELEKVYPCDLSIGEIAQKTQMSDPTASLYVKVLEAEGKIEISRKVGRAIFYRLKKKLV
jgi:DNA-binding transcriptional ArsR family regulator